MDVQLGDGLRISCAIGDHDPNVLSAKRRINAAPFVVRDVDLDEPDLACSLTIFALFERCQRGLGGFSNVHPHDLCGQAFPNDLTSTQQASSGAKSLDCGHIMAYKQNGPSLPRYIRHFTQALPLKRDIAYREHFINDENFRLHMSRHGKSQTDIHPTGIALYGSIDKFLGFREGDDLVELAVDLRPLHAQYCSVQ